MIMCLLAVVAASLISVRTVVAWRVSHETVLQALVPLFVPFEVSDHFFFLDEHSWVAVETMEVLSARTKQITIILYTISSLQSGLVALKGVAAVPIIQISTPGWSTFLTATEPPHVTRVIATGWCRAPATSTTAANVWRCPLQHHGDVIEGRSDRGNSGRLRFSSRSRQRQRTQGSFWYSVICEKK